MKTKTVRFTPDDIVLLSGFLYHADKHYREVLELNISDFMNENAKRDLERLEQIKKKLGIIEKS